MTRLIERWRHLSRRDQVRLAIGGGLCMLVLAHQHLYRPQAMKLKKARGEWSAARQQVLAMRATLPNLEQERQQLQQETEATALLKQEIEGVEKDLISRGELGRLLGELARQGEGLQVAFESIKQHVKEDPQRPAVVIDATFKSSYEDLVNYLRRVEQLSPFLRIARLEVAEPQEGPRSLADMRLTVQTPLRLASEGEGSGVALTTGRMPPPEKVSVRRSPFASRRRPGDDAMDKTLKVTGITWRGEASTAIINDEVVQIGDKLGELTVQQILPDTVILSDGMESYAVAFEQ